MALCSLPRTNPGNRHQYKRANGPFKLVMVAGADNKLPYGNLPRLILAWICTEAVKTWSRELILGKSLSKFMRTLGIYNSGGKPQTRLRNQMKRLFGCTVSMIYEDEHGEQFISSLIAERGEFWWSKPDELSLWDSKIELGEDLFYEIINHPVPIDMNILTALKRYSLGLDLYLWLTPTAPSPSVIRYASPGGRCTASSVCIRTKPATSAPSLTSGARFCAS